jgi:AcrR family transcriptional regulator
MPSKPVPESSTPRTQVERRAATRSALLAAARALFAERGYADVGTEEIVRAAGVTRGALYHHFDGKEDLFVAVFEAVEEDLLARIAEQAEAVAQTPLGVLTLGIEAMLGAATEPGLAQITLIDAPAVLGWQRWREIGWRYGMGLTESVLDAAIAAGELPPQPTRPLAHVLLGALDEAILYVARSPDPAAARAQMSAVLTALLGALRA